MHVTPSSRHNRAVVLVPPIRGMACGERHTTGIHGDPKRICASLSPGMCKLDTNCCPICVYDVDDTLGRCDMLLALYPTVTETDTTSRKNGNGFRGDGSGSSAEPLKWRWLVICWPFICSLTLGVPGANWLLSIV